LEIANNVMPAGVVTAPPPLAVYVKDVVLGTLVIVNGPEASVALVPVATITCIDAVPGNSPCGVVVLMVITLGVAPFDVALVTGIAAPVYNAPRFAIVVDVKRLWPLAVPTTALAK
jgi:hypothetical protein